MAARAGLAGDSGQQWRIRANSKVESTKEDVTLGRNCFLHAARFGSMLIRNTAHGFEQTSPSQSSDFSSKLQREQKSRVELNSTSAQTVYVTTREGVAGCSGWPQWH